MSKRILAGVLAGLFAPMEGEGTSGGGTPSAGDAKANELAKVDAKAGKAPKKPKTAKAGKGKGKGGAVNAGKKKAKGTKGLTGPAVLKVYAPKYNKDKVKKTAGGNVSVDNNDKLAQKLRGATLDEVYEMAVGVLNKALEEGDKPHTVASLKTKYKGLNLGMQRMNLGNRMRAVLNAK